jgi:uncharacterized protein YceK
MKRHPRITLSLITLLTLTLSGCSQLLGADADTETNLGSRNVTVALCLSTTSGGTNDPTASTCATTTATFNLN